MTIHDVYLPWRACAYLICQGFRAKISTIAETATKIILEILPTFGKLSKVPNNGTTKYSSEAESCYS
jgi:hypothetical protein